MNAGARRHTVDVPTRLRRLRAVHRSLRGRSRRGEEGFTLLAVLGVMAVGLLLATTVVTVTVASAQGAAADRGASIAQAAAEAGVHAGEVQLLGMDRTRQSSFVCTPAATTVFASPGSSSVTTVFTFYTVAVSALTASSTASRCPLLDDVAGSAPRYKSALVAVTATYTVGSTRVTKAVSGLVDLAANTVVTTSTSVSTATVTSTGAPTTVTATIAPGGTVPYAFYGADVSSLNDPVITAGRSGTATTAIVNSNRDVNLNCGSQFGIDKLLVSGGNLSLASNACAVAGDVEVTGTVTAQNGGSVGGHLWSSGGSMNLGQNSNAYLKVSKGIRAAGSVTWYPGCTVANKCYANGTLAAPAPTIASPPVFSASASNLASWSSGGYTDQRALPCSGNPDSDGTALAALIASSGTGGLLITVACDTTIRNISTITLQRNVVVLSSASISAPSTVKFQSSGSSETRNLYLIGYGASSVVDFRNGLSTDLSTPTYVQAPTVHLENNLSMLGQVYATAHGNYFNSGATLSYVPMTLYGATNLTPTGAAASTTTYVSAPVTTSTSIVTSTSTSTSLGPSYGATLNGIADQPVTR